MNCVLCTLFMANKFDLIWFDLRTRTRGYLRRGFCSWKSRMERWQVCRRYLCRSQRCYLVHHRHTGRRSEVGCCRCGSRCDQTTTPATTAVTDTSSCFRRATCSHHNVNVATVVRGVRRASYRNCSAFTLDRSCLANSQLAAEVWIHQSCDNTNGILHVTELM